MINLNSVLVFGQKRKHTNKGEIVNSRLDFPSRDKFELKCHFVFGKPRSKFKYFKFYLFIIIVCEKMMSVWGVCATVHMWRSEDNRTILWN